MDIKSLTINGKLFAKYAWEGDILKIQVVEKLMKHDNIMASNEGILATIIGMYENHPYTKVEPLGLTIITND